MTPARDRGSDAATAELVEAVRSAGATGRRLALRGHGSWWPEPAHGAAALPPAPAGISRLDPADLVVTCGGATPLDTLGAALAEAGTFVALDAPGAAHRTVGSVLATACAGPLAAGCGAPRDQVLGITIVAGNGTVVRAGGRVVKNVAGFDLAKMVVGGFGAYGCIAEAHLRLRAVPPHTATRAWTGSQQRVRDAAARILASGATPAALEAVSPALAARLGLPPAWVLLVRASGTVPAVAEELEFTAQAAAPAGCDVSDVPEDAWRRWAPAVGGAPVLLRIGAGPASWHDAVALAHEHVGTPALVSVTVTRGTVRAGFADSTAGAIARLRAVTAARGWPVTLERAGADLRAAAGIWGALPAGTLRLARSLRAAFDPNGVFEVPLWERA